MVILALTACNSIFISSSGTGWPFIRKPSFSSSSDKLPSLSLSMVWNIWLYLSISSVGKFMATTCINHCRKRSASVSIEGIKGSNSKLSATYSKCLLLKLVHRRELLQPRPNNLPEWHIWSLLSILEPRMLCFFGVFFHQEEVLTVQHAAFINLLVFFFFQ